MFQQLLKQFLQKFVKNMGRGPQNRAEWMQIQDDAVRYLNKTKGAPPIKKEPFQGFTPKIVGKDAPSIKKDIPGEKKITIDDLVEGPVTVEGPKGQKTWDFSKKKGEVVPFPDEGIRSLMEKGDLTRGTAPKTTEGILKAKKDRGILLRDADEDILRIKRENKDAIQRFKKKMDKDPDKFQQGGIAPLVGEPSYAADFYDDRTPMEEGGMTQEDFNQFLKEREEGHREGGKYQLQKDWERYKRFKKYGPVSIREAAQGGRIGMAGGGGIIKLLKKFLQKAKPKPKPKEDVIKPFEFPDAGVGSDFQKKLLDDMLKSKSRLKDFDPKGKPHAEGGRIGLAGGGLLKKFIEKLFIKASNDIRLGRGKWKGLDEKQRIVQHDNLTKKMMDWQKTENTEGLEVYFGVNPNEAFAAASKKVKSPLQKEVSERTGKVFDIKTEQYVTPGKKVDKDRVATADELEDAREIVDPSGEAYMVEEGMTIRQLEKMVADEKAYERHMFLEYKKGNLDPTAGDKSPARKEFLEKKLEDMEMSGDKRLMTRDEIEELSSFDLGTEMDEAIKKPRVHTLDERTMLKQKYPGISDDLLEKILVDDNPQRKADVIGTIDDYMKLREIGKGEEEAFDIITRSFSKTPTKHAEGGRIGYAGGGKTGLPAVTMGTPQMNMQQPQMPAGPQPAGIPGGTIVAQNQMQQAPWMGSQMSQPGGMPQRGQPNPGGMPRPMAAEGGRIGFGLGGFNKARRAFLKLIGGITAGGIAAGTGILKLGKAAKVVPKVTETIVQSNAAGMPAWFPSLVKRVIKEGDDVTGKAATIERQTVHSTKLPESGTELTVTRDLTTDDVIVDIGYGKHGWEAGYHGQPTRLVLKKGEWIEPTKTKKGIKTKDEFTIEEAEFTGGHPENIKFEESSIEKFGEHGSNFDEVEKFATGKIKKKNRKGKYKSRATTLDTRR